MSYKTSIFECIDSKDKKRCHLILKHSLAVFNALETQLCVLLHPEESSSLKVR